MSTVRREREREGERVGWKKLGCENDSAVVVHYQRRRSKV
jgi:hypothetical protein